MSNSSVERCESRLGRWGARLDGWLESAGDYLNPIMVKETRQAIKSKQFMLWFVLLLIACWITTIGGAVLIGPSIYYIPAGAVFIYAYYAILALPLVVIVPYLAFSSLVSEKEENTRDLIEVSTLTPYQVINGKLGSALLQMIVYLSAVAPCIAFTYLLRGIEMYYIVWMLGLVVLVSIGLSAVGLLLAAAVPKQRGQSVFGILFAVGLLSSFSGVMGLSTAYMEMSRSRRADWLFEVEMLLLHAIPIALYVTTLALVYLGAVALMTFRSANRSTALRIAAVVQQTCLLGFMTFFGLFFSSPGGGFSNESLSFFFAVSAIYWYLAGSLMAGEAERLSHRVRRTLPQSLVGRLFLSWFNPGPGTGYVLAVGNLIFIAAYFLVINRMLGFLQNRSSTVLALEIILMLGYVAAYLGLSGLIVRAIRRVTNLSAIGSALIHFLIPLAGCSFPFLMQTISSRFANPVYGLLHYSSPIWTIPRISTSYSQQQEFELLVVVLVAATIFFFIGLRQAGRELRQQRVAQPLRVRQDERELHPSQAEVVTSPWGDTRSLVDDLADEDDDQP